MTRTAYLAPHGLEDQLRLELKRVTHTFGRLFLAEGPPQPTVWAQNIWYDPVELNVKSIGNAAGQLKAMQRNWWPYEFQLFRRHELLKAKMPHVSAKPIAFPNMNPLGVLGSYTFLSENKILAAQKCASPFPNGEPQFAEAKIGPPSRAYLKLWETFTLLGTAPKPGDICLDLGACPGGWTWVLASLGAKVKAYDRADLVPEVAAMPSVSVVKGDAFQARPSCRERVDWLFSDVICYPEKLLQHVRVWLEADPCPNFVCTLKFQGDEHYGVIREFLQIPGSRIMHLYNNKHELTWVKLRSI